MKNRDDVANFKKGNIIKLKNPPTELRVNKLKQYKNYLERV